MSKNEKCTCKACKNTDLSLSNMQICGDFVAVFVVVGVVFVGLPVVDHMDDGIGCFVRACEREV